MTKQKTLVYIDFETTGLSPTEDYPTEIAVRVQNPSKGKQVDYSTLIKIPDHVVLSPYIQELTGLTTEKLNQEGKEPSEVENDLIELFGEDCEENCLFVAHNANFDLGFLAVHFGIMPKNFVCTRSMAILLAPHENASLQNVYNRLYPKQPLTQEHRAMSDVDMMEKIMIHMTFTEGFDIMGYMRNRLVVMPDRGLVYEPPYAKLLDFSQKYATKRELEGLKARVKQLEGEHDGN